MDSLSCYACQANTEESVMKMTAEETLIAVAKMAGDASEWSKRCRLNSTDKRCPDLHNELARIIQTCKTRRKK